jgi:hypothetical protein
VRMREIPCCLSHHQLEVDVSDLPNFAAPIQIHAVAREIKKLLAYENQAKEGFAKTVYQSNCSYGTSMKP